MFLYRDSFYKYLPAHKESMSIVSENRKWVQWGGWGCGRGIGYLLCHHGDKFRTSLSCRQMKSIMGSFSFTSVCLFQLDTNISSLFSWFSVLKHPKMSAGIFGVQKVQIFCEQIFCICREFLIFSLCCCSGHFTNPTCVYLTSWEWDSTINCLCGAFRNSWDKSYWFYL